MQQALAAPNYGMNLHPCLPPAMLPAMLHDVPYLISTGGHGFNAQDDYSYPRVQGPAPYRSIEPLQQPSRQHPIIDTNPSAPESCYSQQNRSSRQGQRMSQTEAHNYQGYFFGTLPLSRVRHKLPIQDQQPMQVSAYRDVSRSPFVYSGNDRAYGRLHGEGARSHNPRKSFSDDARLMRTQEGMDCQEHLHNSVPIRHASSAAYFDPNWNQTGSQQDSRSYRRNSIRRGSSRRRSSVSQYTPPAHGQQPSEGSSTPVGSSGGCRGSEEHASRKVYETIDEDKAKRGLSDPPSCEVARDAKDYDNHVTHHGTDRPMDAERKRVPDCTRESMTIPIHGEASAPALVATNQSSAQNPSISGRPALLDPPQVDYNNVAFMTEINGRGPKRPICAMRRDIDPQKLYVSGYGLKTADINRIFGPYGSISNIIGPFKKYLTVYPGRIFYFVKYVCYRSH